MKNDLISRQAAIEALEREQSHEERPIQETRWFDLGLGKAQDVLSGLPPAQPEKVFVAEVKVSGEELQQCVDRAVERLKEEVQTDRWIPVSERLPEKGKQVLCCNKHGSVFTSTITYIGSNRLVSFGQHHEVIAWMPLPEPYKAEREEEHESCN